MKSIALYALLFLINGFLSSQNISYKLKGSDKFLTQKQVDSISKKYGDNLKYEFVKKEDKFIAIIDLSTKEFTSQSQQFTAQKKEKVNQSATKFGKKVYKDDKGNIIDKAKFKELYQSGSYSHKYDMKMGNNGLYDVTYSLVKKELAEARRKKEESKIINGLLNTRLPSFDYTTIDGQRINSELIKNKVIVLNLWFVGCKPCEEERPLLNKVVEYYKDNNDIIFLAPALNKTEKLKLFLKERPFLYKTIPDAESYIKKLNTNMYPTHLIINKQGFVENVIIGGSDNIGENLIKLINKII